MPNKRCSHSSERYFRIVLLPVLLLVSAIVPLHAGERSGERVYENTLQPIEDPQPLLADHPKFVHPVTETNRFEAPPLIDEADGDLSVRAWRWSYNARGIIEVPNRLQGQHTALIVVHPWGIDDEWGWKTPHPAGVAFQCTPEKNQICRDHVRTVVNPLVQDLRDDVAMVLYSLPGKEDPIRKQVYRSVCGRTTAETRKAGIEQLKQKLAEFDYHGDPLPAQLAVSDETPAIDYFQQFPGLDATAKYNNEGFWDQPIPVMSDIDVDLDDVVIYDAEGYNMLRDFLKAQGVRHILLAGYNTDMCVCSTTAGYENLRRDFNVFLVGDATIATFPANPTPALATNQAVSYASLNLFITQVSWIKPSGNKRVADND